MAAAGWLRAAGNVKTGVTTARFAEQACRPRPCGSVEKLYTPSEFHQRNKRKPLI
jgi:hypothetical protein